jgi:hypothetical protein
MKLEWPAEPYIDPEAEKEDANACKSWMDSTGKYMIWQEDDHFNLDIMMPSGSWACIGTMEECKEWAQKHADGLKPHRVMPWGEEKDMTVAEVIHRLTELVAKQPHRVGQRIEICYVGGPPAGGVNNIYAGDESPDAVMFTCDGLGEG